MPLEIACFNLVSAMRALDAGADRIELCGNDFPGGSIPSVADVSDILKYREDNDCSGVPVHVMIRPSGGSFIYSTTALDIMKIVISHFKLLGVDGFVFGILTPEGRVDTERCAELVRLAGKPCTFHRAFDQIPDKQAALEDLIECGFSTVLTSGGGGDVVEGRLELARLVRAARSRIEIMPGGGLRSSNLPLVRWHVHATWWHSSAVIDDSGTANEEEIGNLKTALDKPPTNGIRLDDGIAGVISTP